MEEILRERSPEETAERLRRAQKAGRLGTWDWNVLTNELLWDGVEAVHGLPEGTFGGTFEGYLRDMHPEDQPRVVSAIQQTAETGSDLQIEYRIVLPDSSVRWVSGRGTCFRDESGATVRMAGTCQDITERRRAEEDKEALLAFAAHELRSPLTSILGFARLLERHVAENPTLRDAITIEATETISRESQRMAEIIEYFLDLARAESRQLEIDLLEFDLGGVLHDEIERARLKAPDLVVNAELPQGPVNVRSDARRLQQVLSNLFDNAIKYGGTPPVIGVRCEEHDDEVVVRVSDNGPGISTEDRPNLFQRFFRGNASSGDTLGLGIGLYLSRQFVTHLGGSLELTSQPGEPTEFSLTLPA